VNALANSFLDRIVERRARDLAAEFGDLAAADRERLACCGRPVRDFTAALVAGEKVSIVAEVKKASPSEGAIAPDIEASKQALSYQRGGAAAISVLTEPSAFGGSFSDLSDVADAVSVPVLAKDFVVDPVQVFAARGHGADAVLLMVSVLGTGLPEFMDLAATLGMAAVVEVVDEAELQLARSAGATLVAVNSRDLRTLDVDRAASLAIVRVAASLGMVTVAASGVRSAADVAEAADAGADAVLVGTSLMRAPVPEDVLIELTGVARRPAKV
jgi:indole-3-glycerol phosphate synthase